MKHPQGSLSIIEHHRASLRIIEHFGWFTTDDGGKLEDTIVSKVLPLMKELDNLTWQLPPEMEYRGLHASLIMKGITQFHYSSSHKISIFCFSQLLLQILANYQN